MKDAEKQLETAIENTATFASHLRYEHRMAETDKYRIDYLVKLHAQDHATGHIHGHAYPHTLHNLH